jgi:VWFA-related protein
VRGSLAAASFAIIASIVIDLPKNASRAAQTPSPTSQQQQAPQQPIFRTEIDVIRLDVSVLDKDRRPIKGLTAEAFTVLENDKPQRIVAVTEIETAEYDVTPSAWMRAVPSDVSYNDLTDQVSVGRLHAIVMDDVSVQWDAVASARGIGRHIVDGMGPSDIAAVVYPGNAGRSEDFTRDRDKLITAVERFERREPDIVPDSKTNYRPGPGGGDMPQRFSPVLGLSNCERRKPIVPAFETIVPRLATVRDRRKTIFLVSPGVVLDFFSSDLCERSLAERMQRVWRGAQRANIHINSIDPGTFRGERSNPRRDMLEIMAAATGGHAVVNTDDILGGVDDLFVEASSYYLVGYQTSNGAPDGKFRRIEVKVKHQDAHVRTRSGYYPPREGELDTREAKEAPSTNSLKRVGLWNTRGLPMRAVAIPLARTSTGNEAGVGVVLSVRLPPANGPLEETVTVIRNEYDENGNPSPMIRETLKVPLTPSGGDELRYDLYYLLKLKPGRRELRLHATSGALQRSGTVFVEVNVPDFSKPGLTVSAVALGTPVDDAETSRTDVLASVSPIKPTSSREFSPNERLAAFVRFYQGGTAPLAAMSVEVQIVDVADHQVFHSMQMLGADRFDEQRSAAFTMSLPINELARGPYLLSIKSTIAGGKPVRKDLVFRMR